MRYIFIIMATLVLMGCATKQKDIIADHNSGRGVVSKVYDVDFDTAWLAVTTVMKWNKAEELHENKDEGYVTGIVGRNSAGGRATRSGLLGAWGAYSNNYGSYVGVWVIRGAGGTATVDAISRNTVVDVPQSGPRANDLHGQISQTIELIKSGAPLPDEPPANIVGNSE